MHTLRRSPYLFRRNLSSQNSRLVVGIRREDPARIWERRCPLTPDAVHNLVSTTGVDVLIQDCERRAFKTADFVAAGARVHETLEPAHIVLGIKETPVPEVLTSPVPSPNGSVARTHIMFSHTVKGQSYNMGLLSKFLQSPSTPHPHLLPRLIDYELLTDGEKRTVGFGWFAGVAGALESLSALSQALLEQGVASPFLHTPRPHTLPDLPKIRKSLHAVGENIANYGTPKSLGPFVIGLTGTGNVSQGALSILSELPIVNVEVKDLPALVANPEPDLRKIYLVHAKSGDYFSRADGTYDRNDYYKDPHLYHSSFHTKVAPYLTSLINAVGWTAEFPRLMTNAQLPIALEHARRIGDIHGNPRARFISVGDISCDVEGGLEFLTHSTTLSEPFFTTRPSTLPAHLPGVQMMAVDILPTGLPLDASTHFSKVLVPYLDTLIKEYQQPGSQNNDLKEALDRATIANEGKLVGKHAWLGEGVAKWRDSDVPADTKPTASAIRKKRVLMLGSGMVAGPAVDEICKRRDIELIVGSNLLSEAEQLTLKHDNAKALLLDMGDLQKVSSLIAESDIVISLLPVPFHPSVAKLCIKEGKHMITASYISPAMKDLHSSAASSDVLLLNEIGLDPGIDHCSAISLLEQLRAQGKKVVSFTSFCGGLPAPESAENVPLGYKFSWSPRGVLSAALNGAKFKLGGRNREISGEQILSSKFARVPVSNVLNLEGIANRDSLPYADTYELGKLEDLRTVLRGTLRYPGFCDLMHSFKSIGLLDIDTPFHLDSWSHLILRSLETRLGVPIKASDPASFESALRDALPASSDVASVLEALQFLTSSTKSIPLSQKPVAAIDHFTTLLSHKLKYEPHERDIVVLAHELIAKDANSGLEEVHTSSLITYGNKDASAMARCVGLPVALAALQVLDGNVHARGVWGPGVEKSVWSGVLSGLDEVGLGMRESVSLRREGRETVEGRLISDFV